MRNYSYVAASLHLYWYSEKDSFPKRNACTGEYHHLTLYMEYLGLYEEEMVDNPGLLFTVALLMVSESVENGNCASYVVQIGNVFRNQCTRY
jgi:hypothetical protein